MYSIRPLFVPVATSWRTFSPLRDRHVELSNTVGSLRWQKLAIIRFVCDWITTHARITRAKNAPLVAIKEGSGRSILNNTVMDSILRQRCALPSPFPGRCIFRGKKPHSRRQTMRPIVNMSEEDLAADRQHAYHNTSQPQLPRAK